MNSTDPKRELLRHTVATLAYRGGKTLRNASEGFASFSIGETTRTPAQILAHKMKLFSKCSELFLPPVV